MPTKSAPNSRPAKSSSTSATTAIASTTTQSAKLDESARVRLHITPFTPALLKVYLNPSVLPLASNISYHSVPTFPEKGFGYLELPTMEAQKLKKKLNGSILKGSKVQIEDAKPEKRKSKEAEADKEEERPVKRAKKEKKKKEQGVLEGIELPNERKVKRGWTEPPSKSKDKRDKKDKKEKKLKPKESKYTKEPELLFKTKLTPVAATALEASSKDKSKDKKKKDKKSSKEVVVHEFEKNTKQPSFLRSAPVSKEKKPAVEYINGKGWVDEDGVVVEEETGRARNRRLLELVEEPPAAAQSKDKTKSKAKKQKVKTATPPPSSSESSSADESSSVVSSDSESESDSDPSDAESQASSSSISSSIPTAPLQRITLTPPSPSATEEKKEVHPLEALFKRPKPPNLGLDANTSTPKRLAPINTSFSFFDGEKGDGMDVDASGNPPVTPFTQQDIEWRGLRSAAPTPDTAAIGRRFSFPWGNDKASDEDSESNAEAGAELSQNTKANAGLPAVDEGNEDEEDYEDENDANSTPLGAKTKDVNGEGEQEESAFAKWFWENRGDNNRAWKKRRREALKAKRQRENRKIGGRRVG